MITYANDAQVSAAKTGRSSLGHPDNSDPMIIYHMVDVIQEIRVADGVVKASYGFLLVSIYPRYPKHGMTGLLVRVLLNL